MITENSHQFCPLVVWVMTIMLFKHTDVFVCIFNRNLGRALVSGGHCTPFMGSLFLAVAPKLTLVATKLIGCKCYPEHTAPSNNNST